MEHFFSPPVRRHSTAEAVEGAVTETVPDTWCCLSAELIPSSPHRFTHTSCSTLCLSSAETGSCHNAQVTWSRKRHRLFSSSGSRRSAHIHTATFTPPSSVKTPLCAIFLDISRASTELFLCTNPAASVKNSRVEPFFFVCPVGICRPRVLDGWPAGRRADGAKRKANQASGLLISLLFPSALLECVHAASQTRRCVSASAAQSGPGPSPSPLPPPPRCTLSDRTAASCFTLIHFQRESLLFFHRSPFPYKQR